MTTQGFIIKVAGNYRKSDYLIIYEREFDIFEDRGPQVRTPTWLHQVNHIGLPSFLLLGV